MRANFAQYSQAKLPVVILTLATSILCGIGVLCHAGETKAHEKSRDDGVAVHVQKGGSNKQDNEASSNPHSLLQQMSLYSSIMDPWMLSIFQDPELPRWWHSIEPLPSSFIHRGHLSPVFDNFMPRVDLETNEHAVKLAAEVPGFDESNLDVTVTDNSISIKGKKQSGVERKSNDEFQSIERRYGSFERTVALPCRVESDKAEAKLKNGILSIVVPKLESQSTNGKKLSIRCD